MRPDPQDLRTDGDVDRIIHLGDVRRRRTARRRHQPVGPYLAALALVALAAWAVWATVFLTLQPARLLTYIAFLLPLALALSSTAALALFLMESRLGRLPRLGVELRRGVEFATVVVLNLSFAAAHRWSVLVFGLSVLLALVAEGLASRRA